jgi:hypothetical protein
MLKYLSKFAMDILPSVAATIIGAYIVNHYINKPGTGTAPISAAVSTVDPRGEAKIPAKAASKPSETSSEVANIPEAGVKAKGISEKAMIEKSAGEKPADKPAEKSADKPSETASIPVETRRHQPAPREKAVAKTVPTPAPSSAQPSVSAVAPVVVAPTTVPPVEATSPVEERRDANELARAAIERLRGPEAARAPDPARIPDTPHVVSAPPPASAPLTSASPVRPLPPPIMVSTPSSETLDPAASPQTKPPYAAARADNPSRPTPPADIPPSPASQPLDLHAEAAGPSAREHTTVAEEVFSAAKSVFHAVLPK